MKTLNVFRDLPAGYYVLGIFAAASVVVSSVAALTTSQDFTSIIWIPLKAILQGENIFDMAIREAPSENILALMSGKMGEFVAHYLPSSQIFLFPFGYMTHDLAVKSWLITNLVATVVFFWAVYQGVKVKISQRHYILLALILVSSGPFRAMIANGQNSIVALAFLALAIHFDRDKRVWLSGICLALSLMKYHLTLPFILVHFILNRSWRPVVICGLIHIAGHSWVAYFIGASPVEIFSQVITLSGRLAGKHFWFDIWSVNRWIAKHIEMATMLQFLAFFIFISVTAYLGYLRWKIRDYYDELAWLGIVSVFVLFGWYHRLYDAVCLFYLMIWMATLKGYLAQRLRVTVGLGVLFYLFPLFRYELLKGLLPNQLVWLIAIPFFYMILYDSLQLISRRTEELYRP